MSASQLSNNESGVRLIEHPISSYAQKIKIALREKGIPFTAESARSFSSGKVQINPIMSNNPRSQIPLLVHSDPARNGKEVRIWDSTTILEYIEERWPDPPLWPKASDDPGARAFARMTEDICDTVYEATNWGYGELFWFKRADWDEDLKRKLEAEAKAQVKELQAWLDGRIENGNDWFGGDNFGWADICVAPIVNRSVHYGFELEKGSKLEAWFTRVKERPAVKETFEEFEKAAGGMSELAKMIIGEEAVITREYRDHRLDWMVKSGGVDVVVEGMKRNNIRFSWPYASTN